MKGILGPSLVVGGILTALLIGLTASRGDPASAAGTGPTIAFGAPSGTTLPVNAATVSPDAWNGFNIHVATNVSGGVTLSSITSNATGSSLIEAGDSSTIFCTGSNPAPGERAFACTALAGQTRTAAGLLGNFVFNASGNGCIDVSLVSMPGDSVLDTYTVNANDSSAQSNVLSATVAKVLVGTGVVGDCPSSNLPTPTFTNTSTPTATNTATPTATATSTPISGSPDVNAALFSLPPNVNSGGGVTYSAFVKNSGDAPAIGVTLKVSLPAGAVITGAGACKVYIAPDFYCAISNLAANNGSPGGPDEAAVVINARVPYRTHDDAVTTTVMVSATNEPLANQGNNTASVITTINGCPDLDQDGVISILDVSVAAASYPKSLGDPGYNPLADQDGDNTISVLDLGSIAQHLGEFCSGVDSDNDGLANSDEAIFGSNPNNPDTDGDGLPDGIDVYSFGASPTLVDTDGDNYTDGEEAALGKAPAIFCKVMRADVDKDNTVTILDLSLTAGHYQENTGDPGWDPVVDFDNDGVITILDLSYQASVYFQNINTCA